jgi:DNA-binding response OmpR family regulator
MKILLIEDEEQLSKSILEYLKNEKYSCDLAENYGDAKEKLDLFEYDCILLDINLPDGNGLNLLNFLKEEKKSDGVIIISAKNSLDDKVEGLTLGADDYLSKPFHLSELSARIAAIIRRKNFDGNYLLKFEKIIIDTQAKNVTIDNQPLELTRKEFDLLLYFISNKKKVISKNAIAEHLWGDGMEGNNDFIYTHIKNLRKKLFDLAKVDYIKSVYGMGYKFSD